MAIDGTYKGVAKALFKSTGCDITLATDGNVLTGSATALGITAEVQNGVVNGDSFNCQVEGDGPLGHMVLAIEGKVVGDVISGTIKAGRIKAKFEGTRV